MKIVRYAEDKKKIINWREMLIDLFPDRTERELNDNSKWCPECDGLGLVTVESKHIKGCVTCLGKGQINLCTNKDGEGCVYGYTVCKSCLESENEKERIKGVKIRYKNAKKVTFENYKGKLFDPSNDELVVDKDEFIDSLSEMISEGEFPKYVWGLTAYQNINVDMVQVVSDACEGGYEDQFEHLSAMDDLNHIQEAIDTWITNQGDAACCYNETNVVVLLDDIIVKLQKENTNGL